MLRSNLALAAFALAAIGGMSIVRTASAQVMLDTPAAGLRDGSENAGSRSVGPALIRKLPDEGVEITQPADPLVEPGPTETAAQREVRKEIASDAQDQRVDRRTGPSADERTDVTEERPTGNAAGNRWRFVYANNHWWYYLPSQQWVFYYSGRWVPFSAQTYGQYYPRSTPADAAAPGGNLANTTGSAQAGASRYRTGYRGPNSVNPNGSGDAVTRPMRTPGNGPLPETGGGAGMQTPRRSAPAASAIVPPGNDNSNNNSNNAGGGATSNTPAAGGAGGVPGALNGIATGGASPLSNGAIGGSGSASNYGSYGVGTGGTGQGPGAGAAGGAGAGSSGRGASTAGAGGAGSGGAGASAGGGAGAAQEARPVVVVAGVANNQSHRANFAR